jgi:hypothetical protein
LRWPAADLTEATGEAGIYAALDLVEALPLGRVLLEELAAAGGASFGRTQLIIDDAEAGLLC